MEHKYKQLVLFPHLVIEAEPPSQDSSASFEPYEVVTQQQLARVVSLLLMVAFTVFLAGYTIGKNADSRTYDSLIPAALYGVFYTPEPIRSQLGPEAKEYARVATIQEAVTLKSRVKNAEIVTRISCTVSGKEKKWYQVVLLQKG